MVSHVESMLSSSYIAKKLLLVEIELISNSSIMFIYRLPVPVVKGNGSSESRWRARQELGKSQ